MQGPQPTGQSASLYVGDLNPDVTEGKLFELFNRVGPVASIRVCRDVISRRSRGYAYVNFHSVGDAERALDAMNYTVIMDRPCRIMWQRRNPDLRKSGAGNVFIKNLGEGVDNQSLMDTFSSFGNILSCKVALDAAGKCKGYGYVHFEAPEAAEEAIASLNGIIMNGNKVTVQSFVRRESRPQHGQWTNVYIKNVPKTWDEERLRAEFSDCGEMSSVVIAREKVEDKEVSKGFGYVNFASHEAASKAVEKNGMVVNENGEEVTLYVNRHQKKTDREREIRRKSEETLAERNSRYQGMNLYVKNLEDSITDDRLREMFAPFGTIVSAKVMRFPETNASKGFGFVCFSSADEASKAIQGMNHKTVESRVLMVTLYQRKDQREEQKEAMGMGYGAPRYGAVAGGFAPLGGPGPVYPVNMSMYMQGQAGAPPRANPYLFQGMMPRGGPRAAMPMFNAPRAYPVPAYQMGQVPVMPMNFKQPRGAMPGGPRVAGRGPAPMGGRGPQMQGMPGQPRMMPMGQMARGMPAPQGYSYTAQARNQKVPTQGAAPSAPATAVAAGGEMEPLDHSVLARADVSTQKDMIGERLYPLIEAKQPQNAPKITGMLLEMDNAELLGLLEDPAALNAKVDEAMNVLARHQQLHE